MHGTFGSHHGYVYGTGYQRRPLGKNQWWLLLEMAISLLGAVLLYDEVDEFQCYSYWPRDNHARIMT